MTTRGDFAGKVALVTGASGGIGRAIASGFGAEGASVVVHYRQGESAAKELVAKLHAAGAPAIALGADLSLAADVDRLFETIARELGGLDVLVNNAGIYPAVPLVEMSSETFEAILAVNLVSVHLATRAAAKRWIANGSMGAVVNVASIEGLRPAPSHAHYDAAKSGVLGYTRAAALELGPHGIRVNAVSPGLISREGLEEAWPEGVSSFLARAPLGRLGRPEDVAEACLFLASSRAAFITGANLVVDGGVLIAKAF